MTSPQIVLEVTQCGGRAQNGCLCVPVRTKMKIMCSREKKVKNASLKHLLDKDTNVYVAVRFEAATYKI